MVHHDGRTPEHVGGQGVGWTLMARHLAPRCTIYGHLYAIAIVLLTHKVVATPLVEVEVMIWPPSQRQEVFTLGSAPPECSRNSGTLLIQPVHGHLFATTKHRLALEAFDP